MRASISDPLPRREGGVMSALGKLVRTTAFKLLLAYLLVFMVFAFATLGYVAWSARRVLDAQFASTIDAEINGLREQFGGPGGLRRLVATVERRSRMLPVPRDDSGRRAGRRQYRHTLPPGVLDRPGQFETAVRTTTRRRRPTGRSSGSISCPPASVSSSAATWRKGRACARPSRMRSVRP